MREKDKQPTDNAVCGRCGKVEQWWNIIDNWVMVDGVKYCRSCQKRLKIGHYAPDKNDKNV